MAKKTAINKITSSKLFWIIISVLASLFLWMYVTTTEGTEREKQFSGIQVEFIGEDVMRDSRGLIITNVENNSVSVTLSGNRRTLSNLDATSITATIDLSSINRSGLMQRAFTLSYPDDVDSGSITVVREVPSVISFTVDELSTKPVELKGTFNGTVAEGYTVKPMEFEPVTVNISGSEDVISQVAYAMVVIEREELDKTITIDTNYALMDADGNEIDSEGIELETEVVTVTLPVIATKEIPLSVNIIDGGGATSENCKINISPETITIAGDAEILDGINKIDLGSIDLSDVETSIKETFQIIIPNDTENLDGITEATVTLEIEGLATQKMTITNFSCINVADGYTAEVITQSLEVTVRASEEVLEEIADNNLRAVADLTEYGNTTGIINPPVKIYPDGYSTAGIVGDYTIYVSIEEE